MLDTDSALYDFIAAPVLAAELHTRPMLDTDSALLDMFAAPVLAAELHSRPMLDTDSALYDKIAAPILAAEPDHRSGGIETLIQLLFVRCVWLAVILSDPPGASHFTAREHLDCFGGRF